MAQRAAAAASPTGGKTSAETYIKAAHQLLDAWGATVSASKVSRLAREYKRQVEKSGFPFPRFLATAVIESAEQRRIALSHPAVARVISYADPTGEAAVHNVMRGGR